MKLLFIIGDAAVGKMTVGQELMKITNLRLFHNHMSIEPVIEIFGRYDGKTISEIRDVIFKNYAASDNYGMIFTMMMDFDLPSEWEYLEHVKGIFEPYGADFYYVELIAPQEIRLKRNISENRLKNKASKRDIETSNQRLINDDKDHRCVSYEGEITFDNYIRIDNSDMEPDEVARLARKPSIYKFNFCRTDCNFAQQQIPIYTMEIGYCGAARKEKRYPRKKALQKVRKKTLIAKKPFGNSERLFYEQKARSTASGKMFYQIS